MNFCYQQYLSFEAYYCATKYKCSSENTFSPSGQHLITRVTLEFSFQSLSMNPVFMISAFFLCLEFFLTFILSTWKRSFFRMDGFVVPHITRSPESFSANGTKMRSVV